MKDRSIVVKLEKDYYPKEAIVTTSCQFLRDNYVFLENDGRVIKVTLTPKEKAGSKKIKQEFQNELINNTLRYNIAQKNSRIREYIIKTALFFSQPRENTDGFLFPDKELKQAQTQDWEDDPLGIAIPWGEKRKKIKKKK